MPNKSRRALTSVLVMACLLCGCGGGGDRGRGQDWPLFRGTPQRLGSDGSSSLPEEPPAVAWVFTDGAPKPAVTFWSSPAVVGSRLYVGGGMLSPFGTRGYLYCLDVASSSATIKPAVVEASSRPAGAASTAPGLLWKRKLDKLVFSSPSLAGGIVLCGEGTHTDTGTALHAFKADAAGRQGKPLWDFPVPGPVEASPCIAGDSVYFGTWDDFYCLKLRTGKQRWKASVVDVLSSPVVAGGVVYVGSGRGEQARPEHRSVPGQQLLALDAATGAPRWSKALPYACSSPITYADGRLVAGAGKGTFILAGGGRSAGVVICHEAASGGQLWSHPVGDNVLAAIPVQAGLVHVACRDGKYYLLSLADGQLLWEYKADAALLSSPILSGDRILLLSAKGVAHCLDFKAKRLLWKMDLPQQAGLEKTSQVFSSPVLVGGRIYVGLAERGLICLE